MGRFDGRLKLGAAGADLNHMRRGREGKGADERGNTRPRGIDQIVNITGQIVLRVRPASGPL